MKLATSPSERVLSKVQFELAYLSLLTQQGVKPLSRWEKPFENATQESLHQLGLKTCVINRSVQTGRAVRELLLSNSDQFLEAYAARFEGSRVRHDPETARFEGRLFGYPPCCVETFATHGYLRNSLRRRDQRILFHWACPGCLATPLLLPEYRRVFRTCLAVRRRYAWGAVPNLLEALDGFAARRLRPGLATALSLGVLGVWSASTVPAAADPLDPHVIAFTLSDDADGDYLTGSEELILGLDPVVTDQDSNSIPDGVDLALGLLSAVDALKTEPSGSEPYVTHHPAFGLETCAVCGESVNMGVMEVRHPLENQAIQIPYIARHFLEHGSFSYSGSLHSGRVNPPLLQFILKTDGRGHLIPEPPGTDSDKDGLRDWEEPAFETDAQRPDSDGDLLVDGIDTARELRQALEALPVVSRREDGPKDRPYVVSMPMDGLETCPHCGEVQTMGFWEVINPLTGESMTIPTMGIHYLGHGGFAWKGGRLLGGQGRVDPRQLQAVLTGRPNLHLLAVKPDQDGDLLADPEETALGRNLANPDEDQNAVRDGLDLARAVVCEIAGLPTTPSSNQVYRLDFPLRGLEQCGICGTNVNMGYLKVTNPQMALSVDVPYIALHALEHDSFSFSGDVHGSGRADVKALLDVLFKPGVSVTVDKQQATLRWMTRAGRTYQVFTAADLQGPWNPGPVIQGDETEKVFTESTPAGAAKRYYKVLVR